MNTRAFWLSQMKLPMGAGLAQVPAKFRDYEICELYIKSSKFIPKSFEWVPLNVSLNRDNELLGYKDLAGLAVLKSPGEVIKIVASRKFEGDQQKQETMDHLIKILSEKLMSSNDGFSLIESITDNQIKKEILNNVIAQTGPNKVYDYLIKDISFFGHIPPDVNGYAEIQAKLIDISHKVNDIPLIFSLIKNMKDDRMRAEIINNMNVEDLPLIFSQIKNTTDERVKTEIINKMIAKKGLDTIYDYLIKNDHDLFVHIPSDVNGYTDIQAKLKNISHIILYNTNDKETQSGCRVYANKPRNKDKTLIVHLGDVDKLLKTAKQWGCNIDEITVAGHCAWGSSHIGGVYVEDIVNLIEDHQIKAVTLLGCCSAKGSMTNQEINARKTLKSLIEKQCKQYKVASPHLSDEAVQEKVIEEIVEACLDKTHPDYRKYKPYMSFLLGIELTQDELQHRLEDSMMKKVIEALQTSQLVKWDVKVNAYPIVLTVNERPEKTKSGMLGWPREELYAEELDSQGEKVVDHAKRKNRYKEYMTSIFSEKENPIYVTTVPEITGDYYDKLMQKMQSTIQGKQKNAYVVIATKNDDANTIDFVGLQYFNAKKKKFSTLDLENKYQGILMKGKKIQLGTRSIEQVQFKDNKIKEKLEREIFNIQNSDLGKEMGVKKVKTIVPKKI